MNASTPDDLLFADYGTALVDAVDAAVGGWVRRCVESRSTTAGVPIDETVGSHIDVAAEECRASVVAAMRDLLLRDIDEQSATPLTILREAVSFPTAVLAGLGVEPVDRDEFDRRAFPNDVYGLTPAGFGDVDQSLVEPGVAWGAAKAHLHRSRRRSGG